MSKRQINNGYLYQNKEVLKLIKLIDFWGYKLFNLNKKLKNCDLNNKKILVSNLAHLGDIIISLRFLEVLKSEFRNVKIYFLCGSWNKELLLNHPYIDGVIVYDDFLMNRNKISRIKKILIAIKTFFQALYCIRKEKFDISFELRAYLSSDHFLTFLGGVKERIGYRTGGFGFLLTKTEEWINGEHEIEHHLRLLKHFLKNDYHRYLSYPKIDYISVEKNIKYNVDSQRYVVVNIFSGDIRKKTDNYELWKKIIEYCLKSYDVYLVGTSDNYKILDEIIVSKINSSKLYNILGMTNLYDLIYLLKNAKFVISVDSLISHILSCYNKDSLILFHGNNDYKQWRPIGDKIIAYKKHIFCSPCFFKTKCNNECFDINFDEINNLLNGKI